MIFVLVGMLVAGLVDLLSTVLAIAGLAMRKRGLAVASLALALFAIVLNAFDWMVVVRGKDTRGEPITWRDDSELYIIAGAQACVLAFAIVAAITARPARRSS
jgi:hypothetical protein